LIGLCAALALGRRWAWIVLTGLEVVVLVTFVFDFSGVLALLLNLARFALLLSKPMRRRVGV
jgi:hypothetical protein